MTTYFRDQNDSETGFLSMYAENPFRLHGITFRTMRHYFNAMKFYGLSTINMMDAVNAGTPERADAIGQDRTRAIRQDWDAVKLVVLLEGLRAMFDANKDLEARLVAMKGDLVYKTGRDSFWGCGKDSNGKNHYGRLLMQVRDERSSNKAGMMAVLISQSVLDQLPAGSVFNDYSIVLPTIYKESSGGGFQQSVMSVDFMGKNPVLVTVFGKVGGKQQTSTKEIIEAKSQATLIDQAAFEIRSQWQNKVDSGYALTMTAKVDNKFLPMLAKKFNDRKKDLVKRMKLGERMFVQAKLDGIRGNLMEVGAKAILQSRNGKDNSKGLEHIVDEYVKHFAGMGVILDGEVYSHGMKLQDISGAARGSDSADFLQFVVYDVYHVNEPDLGYEDRFYNHNVYQVLQALEATGSPIVTIESLFKSREITSPITLEDEVSAIHAEAVGEYFEGVMIRANSMKYEVNVRSSGLVKYKTFDDAEFEIVDVTTPATGEYSGKAVFVCSFTNPNTGLPDTFEVIPLGDDAQRRKYYDERAELIGKFATVKYHQYTKEGKPFHANLTVIRDYE